MVEDGIIEGVACHFVLLHARGEDGFIFTTVSQNLVLSQCSSQPDLHWENWFYQFIHCSELILLTAVQKWWKPRLIQLVVRSETGGLFYSAVCVCHQWLWKRPDQFSGLIEDSFKDRQLPPDLINWPPDQTDRRFTAKHIHNVHHQPRIVSDGRQSAKTAQRKRPPVETIELTSFPSSGNSAQKFQNHLPTNMR